MPTIKRSKTKLILVIPDLHFPYHSRAYCDLITKVLKLFDWNTVVQLGDFVDWPQLSKYPKDPANINSALDDIEMYRQQVIKWQGILKPGAIWHQLCGNHEARMQTYTWTRCPAVDGIIKPLPDLLTVKDLPVKTIIHPYEKLKSCSIGDTILHHGVYYSEHTAASNLKKYPFSFIQGHNHRIQYVSGPDKFSATLGCGCDIKKNTHKPYPISWQHCLGVLYLNSGKTWLDVKPVVKNSVFLFDQFIQA